MAAHKSTGPRSARRRDPGRQGPPRSPRALPEAVVASAALVLVLLAAAWARWAFLGYPFFADDYLFLDQMRDGALFHAQAGPDPLRNYWRPLSRQAYFGVVTLLGASPVVAHVLNLALFAGLLALLFLLARRLAGVRAATVASALVALHVAADVPVLWASGSQDLLAIVGALGALCLLAYGRPGWAAAAMLAGLLSKETVVVAPVIALWMLRRPGEPWTASIRRAAPLFLVTFAWLPVWAWRMTGGVREGFWIGWSSVPAAIAHLPQAFLGIEWGPAAPLSLPRALPPLVPLLLLLGAVAWSRTRTEGAGEGAGRSVEVGLAWALLAALPVAIVVHVWSSYYYLFAVCGLALAAGALVARLPAPAAFALVALVATGSEAARRAETFASKPDPWGTQSHLSRFYFDRSMRWITRYLEDLRRQRPTLPPKSTLFFAGIPAFASWQSGNGALVRWVYSDATIRSYFFADFSLERARRGPTFFFTARRDSLVESAGRAQGLQQVAAGQMLTEHHGTALDAITLALEESPADPGLLYWRAWLRLATGDRSRLAAELVAAGCEPDAGPAPEAAEAQDRLEAGDVNGALPLLVEGIRRHALDPRLHAQLADVSLRVAPRSSGTAMEALVARLLAPGDSRAWRRWAQAQVETEHLASAHASLSRYFELAGPAARADAADRRLLETLRESLPGGRLAEESLKRRPGER